MGKTVLVVDDAIVVRQVVSIALKGIGIKVIEAVNGKDALAKLKDVDVDLIVTDLNMPEMNGIDFIRNLRAMNAYRFLPVIMLTTVSQEEMVKEGKAAGATGWLLKPFNGRKVLDAVSRYLLQDAQTPGKPADSHARA